MGGQCEKSSFVRSEIDREIRYETTCDATGEPDAPSPRRVKDLIEEELFVRRRDLFSALDLVFFDTTSLFFTGNGGDTLGQYGKSKDHRSDCKQMVLGMVK